MSEAYHIEPSVPGGGAMVQGLDSPAASTAQDGTGRRISARSFKLLTAKLKKAPLPELAAPEPAAEAAPLPSQIHEKDVPAVAMPVEAVQPEPVVEEPPQPAALPQFQPIDFYIPKAELAVAEDQPSAEPEPEPELSLQVEPEPATEPALAPLPEFILAHLDFAAPQPEAPAAPAAEWLPEPEADEPDFETPVEVIAEAYAEPETVDTPVLEAFTATAEENLSVAVEEAPAPAEPATDIHIEAAEPETVQSTPEPAIAAPAAGEVAKPHKSELASRVVDAMIKTISTAVYSKPSASERAAFLREMAEVMEQEAAANGEPAPPVREAAITTIQQPVSVEAAKAAPIAETLASRMGPAAALLKPKAEQDEDPFAQNLGLSLLIDPKPRETVEADEESGELAITLLDMMSGGSGTALPHERTLAADTLLRILPRIPVKQLLAVVERVAIMETPPALLVAKLIRDPRHEVVGPLLERCSHISDQDLMNAAPDGDAPKLRMIARRRILSTVLSDYLIGIGEPGVLLTLIRNPGAALSHDAFFRLAEFATHHHGLLAPLATRADLPPPVAFELFWHVPQELRRFIFSRFLTDSETLHKILRITLATHADASADVVGEGKFPSRGAIEIAVEHAANFRLDEASRQFAEIGSIAKDTALRILSDREGEPITVLFKALGYPRSKFEEALARLRHTDSGILRPDRNPEEMQAIFDGLSFNKARILLTYWDWFVRKAGPYAPHN